MIAEWAFSIINKGIVGSHEKKTVLMVVECANKILMYR